jgi:hyperosmotically inducible protein
MVRGLIKAMLIMVVLVAGAFFVFGYWTSGSFGAPRTDDTTGNAPLINTTAARERGAEIGEKAARAAASFNESLGEGSLTAKIKAKMVLDDLVKARAINVTTSGSTVTLTGNIHSSREHERAVQLAKETEGVTQVNDQLVVREP